jgi:hypothetical protein
MNPSLDHDSFLHKTEPVRTEDESPSNIHANDEGRDDCRYCRQAIRVEQPFEPLTLRENLLVWTLLIGGTAGLAIAAVKAFS